MTHHYDTTIIGAGLAGLTAAAQLAHAGHRPLLIERNPELGGRARTDDLDGFLFNQGGHALYCNGIGHTVLRGLGVEPQGEPPPLAGGQLLVNGRTSPLPIDAKGLLRTKALSSGGKLQFAKLLASLGKVKAEDYSDVTVDDWLAGYRPDVQAAVKAFVRLSTYAAATDIMSADAAISQLAGADNGVLYLHDGWGALCAQIADAATTAGATIVRGAAVDAITPHESGFSVATADELHESTTVIVAAGGPSLAARMLDIDDGGWGEIGPAPKAAVLDLALDAMPSKHRFVLGVDEPTYFSVHSPPARLAPEGKVAAVAMRYIAGNDTGTADEHRESLERIAAAAGIGVPARSRFLRSMTVTNGMPIAAAGGMKGRPGAAVADRPGAFIAGDWVGHRGLLADAAIASGIDAAHAAAQTIQRNALV